MRAAARLGFVVAVWLRGGRLSGFVVAVHGQFASRAPDFSFFVTLHLILEVLPRSGAERLEVDVDSDTPHLVSRAEPACRPVKRAAGPAAAAEKCSVSDLVGCKPSAPQFWQLVYFCVE